MPPQDMDSVKGSFYGRQFQQILVVEWEREISKERRQYKVQGPASHL